MDEKKTINIGSRIIGDGRPVFIIAEAGVNHNGDMKLAKKMIEVAKECGADAVKFQSFNPERMITKTAPCAEYHKRAIGDSESWYMMLKRLALSEDMQKDLYRHCAAKGIPFLSTPYDEISADFLHSLGVNAFKIASTDTNNIPLLRHIAQFKKPVFLSAGMSVLSEIKESAEAIKGEGNTDIVILQCTANYPPRVEDANLNVITTIRQECGLLVGYSDHLGLLEAAVASIAKGACVYETHFTLDRKMSGPDHQSSVEPETLQRIIDGIRLTEKLLGSYAKEVTPSESETVLRLRKSIVAALSIKKGERLTADNIGVKRPGTGLAPSYFYKLLGKTAKRDIARDELIHLEDLGG